jgi:hypothetical protein
MLQLGKPRVNSNHLRDLLGRLDEKGQVVRPRILRESVQTLSRGLLRARESDAAKRKKYS